MTRLHHDQFAKDCLECLLSAIGKVQTAYQINPEVQEVDVYFQPTVTAPDELGLLKHCVQTPALFEPFRNPVSQSASRACLAKLIELHNQLYRSAAQNKQKKPADASLPRLWIITPTLSQKMVQDFGATQDITAGSSGVYLLPATFRTGFIAVHQLPVTPETLWFRLMGRGSVQAQAIAEVAALPQGNIYRSSLLEALASLKVMIESRKRPDREERNLLMQLSPLYLEKIQAAQEEGRQEGRQEGYQALTIKLLAKRCGVLTNAQEQQVLALSQEKLDALGEALLDFNNTQDLMNWLTSYR